MLLAASLLPSTGLAAEVPTAPAVTPLEQIQQETAQQRWERLKARYQPVIVPNASISLKTGGDAAPVLPIPEGQPSEEWAATSAPATPPLLDASEEPAWIKTADPSATPRTENNGSQVSKNSPASPVNSPAVNSQQVVESSRSASEGSASTVRSPIPPAPRDPFDLRFDDELSTAPLTSADVSADAVSTVAAQTDPAPPMQTPPDVAQARRPVRAMSEIQPFYDTDVDADIRQYAEERAADYHVQFGAEDYQPRMFADTAMAWEATNMYHYPLYFEDAVLERYGHSYPFVVQPFVSVAKFSGQLLALPYQMTLDPINKPMYPLGWYRPGECAPKLKYQVPWNAQAAAVQAGVTTGLIFLIP